MVNSELVDRKLFLFPDGPLGRAMLWIRNADGVGSVGVPCQTENLESALNGVTYHVAAPGVECAFRPSEEGVELELLGAGGVPLTWTIERERLLAALVEIESVPEEGNLYLS